MKLITRDTDYAIRALCMLQRHEGEVLSVDAFVKEIKISRPFMRKILQVMSQKGLVRSFKGKGGGFSLFESQKDLSVLDVMKVFQGPFKLTECILMKRPCPNKPVCKLRKKVEEIDSRIEKDLKGLTIRSLLK